MSYQIVATTSDYVALIDNNDGVSITNDAENIVRDLITNGLVSNGTLIIYRDTLGQWDQLCIESGKFIGYRILGARTLEDALRKVRL